MIPFGLLSGFMDSKEIRITELGEDGFRFRLTEECPEPEQFRICFYDMKKAGYRKVEIRKFEMNAVAGTLEAEERCVQENDGSFFREYSVRVEQKDYVQEVQRLAGEYSRYIRLKLDGDDGELAKTLTGYPAELDEVHCESLEEQKKLWFGGNSSSVRRNPDADQSVEESFLDKGTELALELNGPSLYEEYLCQPLQDFLASYWQKNYLTHSWLAGRTPERFYIGNQFCHLLFTERKLLFEIIEKAAAEQVEITLVFSYIREYMLDYITELLDEINRWCEEKRQSVEIVVNDWGMASLVKKSRRNLIPSLGILLNKRRKDPRIPFKKGEQKWFERNSLNAGFYRNFLEREYGIQRFEWESCGYEQQIPPGKNSLHIPFYQTNTSQYCPLGAVCETGERGRQKLAKKCPGYCTEYALLYPEHLHMIGRYNSLFGIDMRILKEEEILKNYIQNGVDRVVIRAW